MEKYPHGYVLKSKISALNSINVINVIENWIKTNQKNKYVCICNTHSLVTAIKNSDFNEVLKKASLCTPDGMPLVWALRELGYKAQERVDGPNLMLNLSELASEKGYKIFLYGGTEGVLSKLEKKLKETYNGIQIVGKYSPPFRDLKSEENMEIVNMINSKNPDVTFVSLGCPKQEKWMYKNYKEINSILIGVGAAFNYTIGEIKRPPYFFQRIGLEWSFRLIAEPKRLWKRYLFNNTIYIFEYLRTYRKNKIKTLEVNKHF